MSRYGTSSQHVRSDCHTFPIRYHRFHWAKMSCTTVDNPQPSNGGINPTDDGIFCPLSLIVGIILKHNRIILGESYHNYDPQSVPCLPESYHNYDPQSVPGLPEIPRLCRALSISCMAHLSSSSTTSGSSGGIGFGGGSSVGSSRPIKARLM
jgi:hypothetical protein